MAAAIRVIATRGLGAATATIAKEAGVSNGSLFTYFATKADLFNQLYREIKADVAAAAFDGLPGEADVRDQVRSLWCHQLRWATTHPDKRRALAHLAVSADITPESHRVGSGTMSGVARLLQRSRENGPMRDAPLDFVVALMSALADATIDFMIDDPARADDHCRAGFEAFWRMVA